MDELADCSSAVMEFKPPRESDKQAELVDCCVGTDLIPPCGDNSTETIRNLDAGTQTQGAGDSIQEVNDKKLAQWLRKILPAVEMHLMKGPTPLLDSYRDNPSTANEDYNIQIYQKISMGAIENSQGIATWLSVHTNNAPFLVASSVAPHDEWCEHVEQTMKVFMPKRVSEENFVVFTEVKSVPIKACLQCLCTNPYNKNIFAGSTMDGDLHIWQFQHSADNYEIEELHNTTSAHGCAAVVDWATENRLFGFFTNGRIVCYNVGKQLVIENDYTLKLTGKTSTNEITAGICLSANSFVVGTKDGGIYYCACSGVGSVKKQLEITPMKKHLFVVSTLLKTQISGHLIVISCDLSGQVYYHDVRNVDAEEEAVNVIVQIPLPFKNAIACSNDGSIIYCPGTDGSLECFRITYGTHIVIKGALRGKANYIKCSDNGCWIITGLYQDDFQIFYLEQ